VGLVELMLKVSDLSQSEPRSTSPSTRDVHQGPQRRRKRRPWLLYALAGAAGLRLLGSVQSPREASPPSRPSALAARLDAAGDGSAPDGQITTAALSPTIPWLGTSTSPSLLLGAPAAEAPKAPGATATPKRDDPARAKILEAFELAARPVVPGRSWQDAANAGDWSAVALVIDGLPEDEQQQSGARYARAMAARELGQCDKAIVTLAGLENEVPILATEITSLRAQCQLEVGPYEAAYEYFNDEATGDSLTLAARAAIKLGDLAKAELTIDRALVRIKRQGGRSARQKEIAARALHAEIVEARGQLKAAAKDWLWLATETPTDSIGATADDSYERLSGTKLGSAQRLERLRTFAREGQLDRTLREAARLEGAPGPAAPRVEVVSAEAWAYYHSRSDYLKAAELFQQAAELSPDTRAKYLFYYARALSRFSEDDRAREAYENLIRRYPGSGFTEQAYYRIARLEYGRGRWDAAERAYTDYLERYARGGGGQYASASRYELAITRLGAKQRTDDAAATLGQLARKERRVDRRLMLSHLEAVGLETTREPAKVAEAVTRYRAIMSERPLSFAAMESSARLRALGELEQGYVPGQLLPLYAAAQASDLRLPEKAQFLADIGLHSDAERALFDARRLTRDRFSSEGQSLCKMYGSLDRGFRSYTLAERLLRSDEFSLGSLPSANNVWAWRCAYPQPYRDIVGAVENHYHLPPSLVHAVMRQESGFRPAVVSPVGAVGLMQLMPNTARRAAEEIAQQPGAPWVPDPTRPTNVTNNVELGGYYLSKLLGMLGRQLPVAVAAYNAGPTAVSSWLAGGEDLPMDVWVGRIPYSETRDYVAFVLGNWLAYRYLDNPTELPELELALIPGTRAAPDAY